MLTVLQTTLCDGNIRVTAARQVISERGDIDGRTESMIQLTALVYDHGQ